MCTKSPLGGKGCHISPPLVGLGMYGDQHATEPFTNGFRELGKAHPYPRHPMSSFLSSEFGIFLDGSPIHQEIPSLTSQKEGLPKTNIYQFTARRGVSAPSCMDACALGDRRKSSTRAGQHLPSVAGVPPTSSWLRSAPPSSRR